MAVQETTTQTILPGWYTDYAQKLHSRALSASEEPYQKYNLPRIAGFSPEQEQAFGMAGEAGSAYEPYLSAATQATAAGAGSFTDPGMAQRYMNPYLQNVVSGIGSMAGRNLTENILPSINRTFVGGGTFGGSRSAEFMNRAVRDANATALSQQMDALNKGYDTAANLYGAEASRRLTAGEQMGRLGEAAQTLGLRNAAALEAVGRQRQDLGQRSADLSYSDWQAQRDYPWTQLRNLVGVAGTPSASGATTTVTQAPGPSGTSQVLGGLGGLVGLIGATGGFDKGGWLSSLFAEGGEVKKKVPQMKAGLGWLKDKN